MNYIYTITSLKSKGGWVFSLEMREPNPFAVPEMLLGYAYMRRLVAANTFRSSQDS